MRPVDDDLIRALPESRIDDVGRQERSNAYEVGLIETENRLENGGSLWLDDFPLERSLTIDEPQPLIIKIDLGGGNFANVTAKKNSNALEVATKFCQDYSLPVAIIEPLCSRITANM
jgi:hypothetical protein